MIRLLFVFLYLTRVVHGTATNTTSATCPEVPEGLYRSVWSILGNCALTLVICLWHTLHVNVPKPEKDWQWPVWHVLYVIGSFLAPEAVIGIAAGQWFEACKKVLHFHKKGYAWSMTHSYFAQNGGFVYRDKVGHVEMINARKFLALCEEGKIDHPLLTENEIKDKSKSDAMSKAIFTIQLLWFVLQVVIRHSIGLVVTLVELDTLCMAVLAVFYLLLWWNKPLSVRCPHIFYESSEVKVYSREELSEAWKPQPGFLHKLWDARKKARSTNDEENPFVAATKDCCVMRKPRAALNEMIDNANSNGFSCSLLLAAWSVLGGLHLTAWNYEFPTEKDKLYWRGAALGLTMGPLAMVIGMMVGVLFEEILPKMISEPYKEWIVNLFLGLIFSAPVVCRVILAVLMFRSLRALPCSAHQIVSWVQYIPHL